MRTTSIVTSIFVNIFFLLLCGFSGTLQYGAMDDYYMAAVLTGVHGHAYNPHLLFVNVLYGQILIPFYTLFPTIGWYYIGEMIAVFISFTTICFVILKQLGFKWGIIISILFLAFFSRDYYLVVQFTQCASILTASGILLFASTVANKKDAFSIRHLIPFIFSIILILWGSIMRWPAYLMGLPFFALSLLFLIRQCWKNKTVVITGVIITLGGAWALHSYDSAQYKNDQYKPYIDIQGPRSTLGDVSTYNEQAIYEDLEENSKSGEDFVLLRKWYFYDTETFTIDSIKSFYPYLTRYTEKKQLFNYPKDLLSALKRSASSPILYFWFVMCLLIFITQKKSTYAWLSLAIILGYMTYLINEGRLVYRVECGFWLYAAIGGIPLIKEIKKNFPIKVTFFIVLLEIILSIYTFSIKGDLVRDPSNGQNRRLVLKSDTTNYDSVFQFINNHPDKMFLLSMSAYKNFSQHKGPPYIAQPTGSYHNTISFGYWTPYLPEITEALHEYGITNPLKDVVNDNVIVLGCGFLENFLEQHYYKDVAVDTLKSFGEMSFFKYRIVK